MNNSSSAYIHLDYHEFYKVSLLRILIIIISLLITSVSVLMMASIIWYERFESDNKRILTNKLVVLICYNGIFASLTTLPADLILYCLAPLPSASCHFFEFTRISSRSSLMALLNLIIVAKYIFIFWKKHPGGIHDEYWTFFIFLWTSGSWFM